MVRYWTEWVWKCWTSGVQSAFPNGVNVLFKSCQQCLPRLGQANNAIDQILTLESESPHNWSASTPEWVKQEVHRFKSPVTAPVCCSFLSAEGGF